MSAALQLTNPREGQSADWVVAWRIIYQQPLNCEPTRREIRLAVWYLFDRGLSISAIMTRTGLSKEVVTGVQDLRKQATAAVPMQLARQSARAAIERSFAMPLAAAGFKDVKVIARFPTEGTDDPSYVDLSTPYEQAIQQAERLRAQERK